MPKIRANGIEIAYDRKGQGHHDDDVPIVLVHGFPYSRAMWDDQLSELTEEFDMITYDLRGHGETEATAGTYSMELLADDLKGLIDGLGVEQVVLGGFSMGGYVALAFYKKYPASVHSLLLLDTRHQADSEQAAQGREQLAQTVERDGVSALADSLPARMLTEATVSNRPEVVAKAREMILQASPQGVAGAARGMAARPDQTSLLPNIAVPTLVMVGEEDAVTPPADSEYMAATIPSAKLVKLAGAAHLSNMEQAHEFSDAIHDFMHD
jgi:3-oxoadipate enol-lactonase